MSDIDALTLTDRQRRRRERRKDEIPLPDGTKLKLRSKFAEEDLGASDKTAERLDLPTVRICGWPYVIYEASLQIVTDKARRRNQPTKRRRA